MRVKKIDKMNQKGMTLIEILVAMAILAVVVVPTLRIFADTSWTNLRSQHRQRATSVAEGTMESLKAYNMESLCRQFMNGDFKGVVKSTDPAKSTVMSVVAVYGSSEENPLRDDFTLKPVPDQYKFKVFNATSEGRFYDIDIVATPRITSDVLKMDDANAYSDAIITLDESSAYEDKGKLEDKAAEKLANSIASLHSGATDPEVNTVEFSDFKRTINITVNGTDSAQTVVVKVSYTAKAKISYKYKSAGASYTDTWETDLQLEHDWGGGDEDSEDGAPTTENTVYDNTATIGGKTVHLANGDKHFKLNQIFLYYFPLYDSGFGTGAADEINLEGTLSNLYSYSSVTDSKAYGYEPLKFTVAKQVTTRLTDTDLNICEAGYDLDVKCTVSGGGKVELSSNLDANLSTVGGVASSPSISGFLDAPDDAKYAPGTLTDKIQDRVALLYDVEIDVYEAGTTNKVAEFTGTMNE